MEQEWARQYAQAGFCEMGKERRETGGEKFLVKATSNERNCQIASRTIWPGWLQGIGETKVDRRRAKQSTQMESRRAGEDGDWQVGRAQVDGTPPCLEVFLSEGPYFVLAKSFFFWRGELLGSRVKVDYLGPWSSVWDTMCSASHHTDKGSLSQGLRERRRYGRARRRGWRATSK